LAVIVKEKIENCVGVPESTPAELRVSPGGRTPDDTVNVTCPLPPNARIVSGPYGTPTVPAASAVGVSVNGVVPADGAPFNLITWASAVLGLKLPVEVSISD